MKKYRYNILNLDCANCAKKIEENLNKTTNLKNVNVNFNTSSITFYLDENEKPDEKYINKQIEIIEPGVYISKDVIKNKKEYHLITLILALSFAGISYFVNQKMLKEILVLLSYALLLYKPLINSVKTLVKGKTINENTLISISSIGALLIGKQMEGIMVVALYITGKILEEKALNNTRNEVKNIVELKQDYANLKTNKEVKKIKLEEIKKGDILIIKKGEKIPVEGQVLKGTTKLDMSMLTGETKLVPIKEKDEVLSGAINIDNPIEIKAETEYENSTVAKILELTLNATDNKAKTETTVTKFSKIYTPTVLILALVITIILPLFGISFQESIYRGLTFLVISCPCAIAISVPLSYFTGLGASSKNGILIKGSNYLDNLTHLQKIIFDKTGTLTKSTFKVTNIEILDKKYTKDEILEIVCQGETLSNHPIATSLLELYNKEIDSSKVKNFKETSGLGLEYEIGNKKVKIGSKKICKDCNIDTNIHVNINNKHVASITLTGGIKEEAKETIEYLNKQNIETIMFTGDKKEEAEKVAKELGIKNIKYQMLPQDKYKEYEKASKNKITAFAGDGINDAPVIKRADIGIAMGQIGSKSAIEAADIVIQSDKLNKIPKAIEISKYTNKIIKQNLTFAIGIKIIILILSIFGLTTMWFAVFADTGVTLLTIINTLRIMKKYNK